MERLVEHPEVARSRMESAACKVSLQLTGRRPFVLFLFRSAYDAVTSSSRETWDQAKAKARDNWEATKDKTGEVCCCLNCNWAHLLCWSVLDALHLGGNRGQDLG